MKKIWKKFLAAIICVSILLCDNSFVSLADELSDIIEQNKEIPESISGNGGVSGNDVSDNTVDNGISEGDAENIYVESPIITAAMDIINSTSDSNEVSQEVINKLFLEHPEYLENEAFDDVIGEAVKYSIQAQGCVTNTGLAAFLEALRNGSTIIWNNFWAATGLTEDYETQHKKDLAKEILYKYCEADKSLTTTANEVKSDFGVISQIYDITAKSQREQLAEEIKSKSKIQLTDEQIDKAVKEQFGEAEYLDTVNKVTKEAVGMFAISMEYIELMELEERMINNLISICEESGCTETAEQIRLVKADRDRNFWEYFSRYYLGDDVLQKVWGQAKKWLAKNAAPECLDMKELSSASFAANLVIDFVVQVYNDTQPNVDEIIFSSLAINYFYSADRIVNNYKVKFLLASKGQGTVTAEDIQKYEAAYTFEIVAVQILAKYSWKISYKIDQHSELCFDLLSAKGSVDKFTYAKYINSCIDNMKEDNIVIPELPEDYDSTESISLKFDAIRRQYVPNASYWKESWGGCIQCFGFARMVFYKLFGCEMPSSYYGSRRYELTPSDTVVLVGRYVGNEVNEKNAKALLTQGKLGDVIQANGVYGQHTMIFEGASDAGVTVYQCNKNGECGVYEDTYSWATFAQMYGSASNGSDNGISLYRAYNYATIYGDGENLFYDDTVNFVISEDGTLTKYNGWQRYVTIPDTVTAIGDSAFKNNTTMISVKIPDGVISIGNSAFSGCTALIGIYMPDSIETVGSSAFYNCTSMENVKWSEKLESIASSAFYNCSSLEQIEIPDSVTYIGGSAFAHCKKLSNVKLSKKLEKMGRMVFIDCPSITEIEIPKSLQRVGDSYSISGAFVDCTGLKTIRFEEGITRIPDRLFQQCPGLEQIEIPNTVTEIGESAFSQCENLRDIRLPETLTTIGSSSFSYLNSLEQIEIPDSITYIGGSAFAHCKKLSNVKLSKKLEKMGRMVFIDCPSITEIEIPKSLQRVGDSYSISGAFVDCTGLKTIRFEEGITRIPDRLFQQCPGLEQIEIPNTVTEIGESAFSQCENLRDIRLPETLTTIGSSSFSYLNSLEQIELPDAITDMGTYVFSGCKKLTKAHIPTNTKIIMEGTFQNCTSLKEVNFPETVTIIRKNAFYNCDALTEITLPSYITTLEAYAFYGCDLLEKVSIPNSMTTMGNNVFDGCSELKNVILGNGLQSIPTNAFANCGKLEEMVIPYGVTKIDKSAFVNDPKLLTIMLPRTVNTIDSTAFSYADKMTVYGVAGTYAEEWAESVGATFVNKEVAATEVSLNKNELTINKGATEKLLLTIAPSNFTDEINWKSGNTNVVTVDNTGKITAKAVGTAVVKVTVGNQSASCKVTVVQPVTSLYLSKSSLTMEATDTYVLTVNVSPSDAFNKAVKWESSDETIATVNQEGVVTALKKGKATITVSTLDGSNIKKTCTVEVKNNAYIVQSPAELESPHPYANNCSDIWVYTLKDAEKIEVTFSQETMLEEDFDYLYLLDKDKNQIGKYTGQELAGKTVTITGDTVRIQLSTDTGGTEYGFKVTSVTPAGQKQAAMPEANVAPGEVDWGTTITLSTSTEGASVYYTVDGSQPTKDSILYKEPIVVEKDTVIKAIAVKKGFVDSIPAIYSYAIPQCSVIFDSNGGTEIEAQYVYRGQRAKKPDAPHKENENFAGWYLDGKLYDFKLPVNSSMTLIAYWTEYEELLMPSSNLRSGMQIEKGTAISLLSEENADVYYTLNGEEPGMDSMIYTHPIVVEEEITIKAMAVKTGFKNSQVAIFHYTVAEKGSLWGEVEPEDIPEEGIPDGMWIAGVKDVVYTGQPIKQDIRVYDGKTRLAEKTDYTLTYKNNTNAAEKGAEKAPSIIVTGKGNYEGKTTITFTILPQSIEMDNEMIVADDLTVAFTGKAQKPVLTVLFNGKKLAVKKDFVMTCKGSPTGSYTEEGVYEVVLNGIGNYTGSRVLNYTITKTIPISKVKVSTIKVQHYTGKKIEPEFTLKYGKDELKEGVDYFVTYLNNVEIGKAAVLIEGIGKYSGIRRTEFKIEGTAITKAKVTGLQNTVYNGKLQTATPVLTVKNGKEEVILTEGVDYTVTYQNNKNTGNAKVIFTGINGFYGTMKKTFKITPFDLKTDTAEQFKVESGISTAFVKTGATPKPVITFNGTVLTEGKDYTLKYANNKKVASAGDLKAPTVTITGKGNFKGSRTVTFDIVPQNLSNLSLEAADKVFQNKVKNYTTKFDVLDSNGKKLAVKKDYEIVNYTYADGSEVKDTDIIPAGTEIFVTVKAKEGSGFTGELTGSYRVVQADISKVAAKVADQTYTGSAIKPGKEDITLTMKKVPLTADDYEIVSYSNNVKKGTANVIIRGVGNYGGTKKITFKIKSKKVGFLWW